MVVAGLLFGATTGCGSSGPPLVDAGGTVTYQGKPVPGAVVTFVPQVGVDFGEAPSATGTTDEDGRFTLSSRQRHGAVVADMKVSISAFPPADPSIEDAFKVDEEGNPVDMTDPQARNKMMMKMMRMSVRADKDDGGDATTDRSLIPMKYGAISSSGLTATVTDDPNTNDFVFDLE